MRVRSKTIRTISTVLVIVGVIFLVVGAIYWIVPADKLPSLLGHVKGTGHRTTRATLATIVGVVAIGAAILLRVWANARHRRASRSVHSERAV